MKTNRRGGTLVVKQSGISGIEEVAGKLKNGNSSGRQWCGKERAEEHRKGESLQGDEKKRMSYGGKGKLKREGVQAMRSWSLAEQKG